MNLVDLATELEYVPKEQLAQMSQDPSSRYPQYLVLSEIQRRTANEKAYAAAKPRPTTTVAEEVVGEFMQPQGLQAGMPSESAPTDAFSSESMGIPASAPMQQPMMGMAQGGTTESATPEAVMQQSSNELKRLKTADKNFNERFAQLNKLYDAGLINTDRYVKSMKTLTDTSAQDIDVGRYRPFFGAKLPNMPTTRRGLETALKQSRNEMQQKQLGFASGGLTGYAVGGNPALQQSFINPLTERLQELAAERYYDEEGDFNYGTALGDATILIPGLGLAGAGLRGLYGAGRALTGAVTGKGLKDKAVRGLQSLFTRPTTAAQRQKQVDAAKKKFGLSPGQTKGTDLVPVTSKTFSPAKTLKTIGYPAGAAVAISRLGGEDAPETPQELQELNTGLGGVVAEKPKKEIDYDLVGLGGLIMGSRNMSEFGKGLSEFATTASKRKIEKEALATQNELRKAQAAKYRADLKTMGFNEIQGEIQLINEAFETGALNIEDPVIQNYLMSLYEALAQRRGGSLQDDILEQQKAS
jgi:hypothetical protein